MERASPNVHTDCLASYSIALSHRQHFTSALTSPLTSTLSHTHTHSMHALVQRQNKTILSNVTICLCVERASPNVHTDCWSTHSSSHRQHFTSTLTSPRTSTLSHAHTHNMHALVQRQNKASLSNVCEWREPVQMYTQIACLLTQSLSHTGSTSLTHLLLLSLRHSATHTQPHSHTHT